MQVALSSTSLRAPEKVVVDGASHSDISPDSVREIKEICLALLSHFNVTTADDSAKHDPGLFELCYHEARSRGYPVTDSTFVSCLNKYLPGGVRIASIAYAHLKDPSIRVLVALYTAFLYYVDDTYSSDVEGIADFHRRFYAAKTQGDVILDSLAEFLHSTYHYFDYMVANIIVTSTLNVITAMTLEKRTEHIKLPPSASRFPTFSRVLSGASEAYGLFAFPRNVPVVSYIHALPELMVFINSGNDVLSYYKEEADGEETNRISTTAACLASRKNEVLRSLSEETVDAHRNMLSILHSDAEALEAYSRFAEGYIIFYTTFTRYRLTELMETQ